jgi:hypothetical protein
MQVISCLCKEKIVVNAKLYLVYASGILFMQRENSCQCKVISCLCKEKIVVNFIEITKQ